MSTSISIADVTDDQKKTWREAYIARLVERGLEPSMALADFEGAEEDHDYTASPASAADESLTYYSNDGDD